MLVTRGHFVTIKIYPGGENRGGARAQGAAVPSGAAHGRYELHMCESLCSIIVAMEQIMCCIVSFCFWRVQENSFRDRGRHPAAPPPLLLRISPDQTASNR